MFSIAAHHFGRIAFVSALLALTALGPAQAASETVPPISLTVATFNLRFASDQGPNAWPDRRPVMKACFQQMAADVIGTQEGVYSQLRDIAADLPVDPKSK